MSGQLELSRVGTPEGKSNTHTFVDPTRAHSSTFKTRPFSECSLFKLLIASELRERGEEEGTRKTRQGREELEGGFWMTSASLSLRGIPEIHAKSHGPPRALVVGADAR